MAQAPGREAEPKISKNDLADIEPCPTVWQRGGTKQKKKGAKKALPPKQALSSSNFLSSLNGKCG